MPPHLLFLCTGNAARSVMAGAVWERLRPAWQVTTAGTLVVEGQPMSWRTRTALEALGLPTAGHRSKQLRDPDVSAADLIVVMETGHVDYVRRTHPEAASKTGTLRRLVRDLPGADGSLEERLAALRLDRVVIEDWENVADPAGLEVEAYHRCAQDISDLVTILAAVV